MVAAEVKVTDECFHAGITGDIHEETHICRRVFVFSVFVRRL